MNRWKWGIATLLALTFIGFFFALSSNRSKKFDHVSPVTGDLIEAVYGLGKVKSNQRFEVKVGVLSTVKSRFVNEGEYVERGQKLIEMDSNALFRAPFSGLVTLISLYEGETALPNATVLRLENLKDRYIELSLEQESALRIRPQQVARVSFESFRNKVLNGTVTAIFPKEGEFLANIKVQDLDESILPGMTADVSVEIGTIHGTLVPYKALRNGTLLIDRHGRSQKIKVEVGLTDGLSAEIKGSDLLPTDLVLVPKEL